jgi:hypothetical protein
MAAKHSGGSSFSFGSGSTFSGPTITLDAETLGRAAQYFRVPAELVGTALNDWENRIAGIGTVWGSGSTANQLGSQYDPVKATFSTLLDGLRDSFLSLGMSVQHAGQAVHDTEEANRT